MKLFTRYLLGLVLSLNMTFVFATEYPIAGVEPSQRPNNAPIISDFEKGNNWYQQALQGVDKPYPASVRLMLLDQEAWYTPFNYAGMPSVYDIRNLHKD